MLHIQEYVDLFPYTTFQVSCIARYFVVIKSREDFQELLDTDVWKNQERKLFLWWGSNMLFVSPTYDGIVIKNEIMGKEVEDDQDKQHITIHTWAWENWDTFVWRSVREWYCGLENLVSIPWTVGASPVQNIGAYGVEVESRIAYIEWIDTLTGNFRRYSHHECEFGYRDSVFKRRLQWTFFITWVVFLLHTFSSEIYTPVIKYGAVQERVAATGQWTTVTPYHVATAIAQIRSEKLPNRKELGTAWSFFKNPVVDSEVFKTLESQFELKWREVAWWYKLSAWQLIDIAWFKGYRMWDIGVYENHALVLINYGERDGSKFLTLIEIIQERVDKMFGVWLMPEVNMI